MTAQYGADRTVLELLRLHAFGITLQVVKLLQVKSPRASVVIIDWHGELFLKFIELLKTYFGIGYSRMLQSQI